MDYIITPTLSYDWVLNFPNGKLIYSINKSSFDIDKIKIPVLFKNANDQPC